MDKKDYVFDFRNSAFRLINRGGKENEDHI